MSPDQQLLGAALEDPRWYSFAAVKGDHFADPTLGVVWDRLGQLIASGGVVSRDTIGNHFADWEVRLSVTEPYVWEAGFPTPGLMLELGARLRADSARKRSRDVAQALLGSLSTGDTDPLDAAAEAARALQEITADGAADGTEKRERLLSEVLEETDTYDWLIPQVLERSDRLVLTGFEGAGKTVLLRQLAVCAAGGLHPFTKEPVEPVNVLVIDAENSERQWRRNTRSLRQIVMHFGRRDPAKHLALYCSEKMDLLHGADLTKIHRMIDRQKPDLVVIGPFYRLLPKGINTDDDAVPVVGALDSIRHRGVALLMEAHAAKGSGFSEERDLRPRGSAALIGWPEFGLGLRPLEAADGMQVALARWRGDRDPREWPRHLYAGGDLPWTPSEPMSYARRLG